MTTENNSKDIDWCRVTDVTANTYSDSVKAVVMEIRRVLHVYGVMETPPGMLADIAEAITDAYGPQDIKPGDVVTLVGGVDRLAVGMIRGGEVRVYSMTESGVMPCYVDIEALRKVEPEPQRQELDDKTRGALVVAAQIVVGNRLVQPETVGVLLHWLKDAVAAPRVELDEKALDAIEALCQTMEDAVAKYRPMNGDDAMSMTATVRRWLAAQGVK